MWAVKVFAVTAGVIILGMIAAYIRSRLVRKRLGNWSGTGVNKDLDPAAVALLMGMHPSALVLLMLTDLEILGHVEVLSEVPLRLRWVGSDPNGAVAKTAAEAIQDDGSLSLEEVLALLEVVYERANGEMGPYSGRETTLYYREVVENMWRQFLDEGEDDVSMIPWLLLKRGDDEWDRIRGGDLAGRVRGYMRRMNLAEQHLVNHQAYLDALKGAKRGYFRYRRDLKGVSRHMITPKDTDYWINAAFQW